ncbi:MAG: hypothetical protein QM790_20365 [Nibricoccus sp.]
MSGFRPVEIVGGGLAGLTLGIGLQRAGVPTTVCEAGEYPRHRVCGEFISGLDDSTIRTIGLAPALKAARRVAGIGFFSGNNRFVHDRLPAPAYVLSRHVLDQRLADTFVAAGGILKTRSPVDLSRRPEGRVHCNGRQRRTASPWIGLKCHVKGVELRTELELHLGRNAYVGLCTVDDTTVNVCGLFRKQAGLGGPAPDILPTYLRAAGLHALVDRLAGVEWLQDSRCAVAGFGFSNAPRDDGTVRLGDAYAMIAPFTGNGMTIAFQSAEEAIEPLIAWSYRERGWREARGEISRRLRQRFSRRLRAARLAHPFLLSPAGQRCFALARRLRLVPIRPWYRLLH